MKFKELLDAYDDLLNISKIDIFNTDTNKQFTYEVDDATDSIVEIVALLENEQVGTFGFDSSKKALKVLLFTKKNIVEDDLIAIANKYYEE